MPFARAGIEGRAAVQDTMVVIRDQPAWLQPQAQVPGGLAQVPPELAERIVAWGEKVEGYLDIKLSVSESRYTNWPPALQQQFAVARTVDSGKPSFTLSLDSE